MGDYAIERFFIGFILYVLLIGLIVTTKKKMIIGITIAVLIGYGVFFVIRGNHLEKHYAESIEIVNEHLKKRYPGEQWIVVDQLEEGRKRRADKVEITFVNEPNIIYAYKVENTGKVVQWEISFGTKSNSLKDLLHQEI